MRRDAPRLVPALLLSCAMAAAPASSAAAQQRADSAAFVIRLGTDTTAIERYVLTPGRLRAEAVSRSPLTRLHELVLERAGDRITGGRYEVREPDGDVIARVLYRVAGDDVVVETTTPEGTRSRTVEGGAGAIPVTGPFYAPYELAIRRAIAGGRGGGRASLVTGGGVREIEVRSDGPGVVALEDQFGQPMRVRHDAAGRLLALETPGSTFVERHGWIDVPARARDFAARDERGEGMGPLSPRDSVLAVVDGANVRIDYYRPAARGRKVFGGLVPLGELWRTGANDATTLTTDRELTIGGARVPAGSYSLFTIPRADAWTLILNRRTGTSGLDYVEAEDLARVEMRVDALTEPVNRFTIEVEDVRGAGGELALVWERVRASVPIATRSP